MYIYVNAVNKMLTRKLSSVYQKQMCLYLSTVPLQKPDIVQSLDSNTNLDLDNKLPNVLNDPDYFNVASLFTIKDLFNARVHYGHKSTSTHPKISKFLFGTRLGHSIFNLNHTAFHLKEALNFTAHIAYLSGIILFVSRNPKATLLVEDTAQECKEYAITREWVIGTFTDSENRFGCVTRLPDLVIILNTLLENNHEHLAVTESAKMCIPTVGIVDSNCDPSLITFPVPGNDDSLPSVQLYCKLFKEAILRGKKEREKHLKLLSSEEEKVNQLLNENKDVSSHKESQVNKLQ